MQLLCINCLYHYHVLRQKFCVIRHTLNVYFRVLVWMITIIRTTSIVIFGTALNIVTLLHTDKKINFSKFDISGHRVENFRQFLKCKKYNILLGFDRSKFSLLPCWEYRWTSVLCFKPDILTMSIFFKFASKRADMFSDLCSTLSPFDHLCFFWVFPNFTDDNNKTYIMTYSITW